MGSKLESTQHSTPEPTPYSTLEPMQNSTVNHKYAQYGDAEPKHSTLEAVEYHSAPEVRPDMAGTAPEVSWGQKAVLMGHESSDSPMAIIPNEDSQHPPPTKGKILGMRRKVFWILLAVLLLLLAGAAVGIGLGVSLSSDDDPQEQSDGTTSGQDGSDGTSSGNSTALGDAVDGAISPFSKLASVSWTESGGDFARLYFQGTNRTIFQAAWDSDSDEWTASALTVPSNMRDASGRALADDAEIDIKRNSPITVAMADDDDSDSKFSLYFLTSDNQVRELQSSSADGPWSPGVSDAVYTTSDDSQLAVCWVAACKGCTDEFALVFQAETGDLQMLNRDDPPAGGIAVDRQYDPISGTSLAMVPMQQAGQDKNTRLFSNSGTLTSNVFAPEFGSPNGGWVKASEGTESLSESAQLAAMSYGSGDNGYEFVQVFLSDPDAGTAIRSVRLDLGNGDTWEDATTVDETDTLLRGSSIAANQAQMLFALSSADGPDGGTITELRVFRFEDGALTSSDTIDTSSLESS